MKKLAQDIRIGDWIDDPSEGLFKVYKYRWHFRVGVEVFDSTGASVATYPYKQEIEVV